MITKAEDEKRMALWNAGYTQRQIEEMLFISEGGLWYWLKKKGLKRGYRGGKKPVDSDEVWRLHLDGLSYKEIAEKLGYAERTVRRKLNTMGYKIREKKELPPEEHARRRALLAQGYNDAQCARILGISKGAFTGWRIRYGLPANGVRGHYDRSGYDRTTKKYRQSEP